MQFAILLVAFAVCSAQAGEPPAAKSIADVVADVEKFEGKTLNVVGWGYYTGIFLLHDEGSIVAHVTLERDLPRAVRDQFQTSDRKTFIRVVFQAKCLGKQGKSRVQFVDGKVLYVYPLAK